MIQTLENIVEWANEGLGVVKRWLGKIFTDRVLFGIVYLLLFAAAWWAILPMALIGKRFGAKDTDDDPDDGIQLGEVVGDDPWKGNL